MSENASYDYEALQKALESALTSLESLRISRDCLTALPGRRFSGGYGIVVKANLQGKGSQLGIQTVAIKKLRMAEDDDLRITIRLVREMKLWAELNHPNIVPFVGFHVGEDVAWLISDWATNGNVQDFLTENEVDFATRFRIVMDVASGLVYLHGLDPPICHGDIKPGNILINHEIRGMLADFGLSRALETDSTGLTTSKTIKGSLRYMSPDLLSQNASHTLASDVWAFGCVALEILTGTPPFNGYQGDGQIVLRIAQGTPPAFLRNQLANDLDPELQSLLKSCWNMSPKYRPTMEECLKAIRLSHDFELVTGVGWSAHFDTKVFPGFDLECLQTSISVNNHIYLVSSGERYLLSNSSYIKTVDIRTNTEDIANQQAYAYLAIEPQNRYLALFHSGVVTVWDSTSNHVLSRITLPPHISPIGIDQRKSGLSISGDGRILIVIDNTAGVLYIWNLSTGSLCSFQLTVRKTGRRIGTLSFDGRYAALREIGPGVEIYDTQSLQFVKSLQADFSGGGVMIWATHSQKVVVGTSYWAKVWDMDASEETLSSPSTASAASREGNPPCWMSFWHPERINTMHMSSDDALLVTICGGKRVTVWDLSLGTCSLVIHLTESPRCSIYVSPIPSEEGDGYALMLRFGPKLWRTNLTKKKAGANEKEIEDSRMASPGAA